jgi:hypothetical protein
MRIALVATHSSMLTYAREHGLDPRGIERAREQADGHTYVLVLRPVDTMGQRFERVVFLHGGSTTAFDAALEAQR